MVKKQQERRLTIKDPTFSQCEENLVELIPSTRACKPLGMHALFISSKAPKYNTGVLFL
jgi:hypothetical protein